MSLIDLYLYEGDGEPKPGVVPTQLHVRGSRIETKALGAIRLIFAKFAADYRLGLYKSLRKTFKVDKNTTLTLEVNHGVFTAQADVVIMDDVPAFYGGIVLPLRKITSAEYLADVHYDYDGPFLSRPRGAGVYPSDDILEPLVEHLPAYGPNNDKPLGLSVPAPCNTNTVDFVIQIARKGDLTQSAISRGLIKIWRIGDYVIGNVASFQYAGKDRYIVSALYDGDEAPRLSSFCLCGQALNVPQTPLFVTPWTAERVRLYTIGFNTPSFGAAANAVGIVVLLWVHELYVYDMANAQAGWQLIDSTDAENLAPFAFDVTHSVNPTSRVITVQCQGPNLVRAVAAASAFGLTLTPTDSGAYSITGQISRADEAPAPTALPENVAANISAEWTTGRESSVIEEDERYAFQSETYDPDTDTYTVTIDSTTLVGQRLITTEAVHSSWTRQTEFEYALAGTSGPSDGGDEFLGGEINPSAPRQSIVATGSSSLAVTPIEYLRQIGGGLATVDGVTARWAFEISGGGLPGYIYDFSNVPYESEFYMTGPGNAQPLVQWASDAVLADTLSMVVTNSSLGTIAYSHTINESSTVANIVPSTFDEGGAPIEAVVELDTVDSREYDFPLAGSVPSNAATRYDYYALDEHRRQIAVRRSMQRTGTWEAAISEGEPTGSASASMGACLFELQVINRGREVRYTIDLTQALAPLNLADAYTASFNGFQRYGESRPDDGITVANALAPTGAEIRGVFDHLQSFVGEIQNDDETTTGIPPSDPAPLFDSVTPGTYGAALNLNTGPNIDFSVAEYEALGDIDVPVEFEWTGDRPMAFPFFAYNLINHYAFESDRHPDLEDVHTVAMVDPRTGGWVAQLFVEGAQDPDAVSKPFCRILVGNEDSVVPLHQLMNDWVRVNGGASEYAEHELVLDRDVLTELNMRLI